MKAAVTAGIALGTPLLLLLLFHAVTRPAPVDPAAQIAETPEQPESRPAQEPEEAATREGTEGPARRPDEAPAVSGPAKRPAGSVTERLIPLRREILPASPTRRQPDELVDASLPAQRHAEPKTPSSQPASLEHLIIIDRIEEWLADRLASRATSVDLPHAPRQRAAALLKQGEFEQAARAFDRLLLDNANDPDLLLGMAMALNGLGRHDDAVPLLLSAVQRDPGNTEARYQLGVTLARLDQREAAIRAFRALLETSPEHTPARFNLAILLRSIGRTREALLEWRELTGPLPDERGQDAHSAPDTGPAIEARDERFPLREAWYHRGEAAMAMYEIEEAEGCFLEVTRRSPEDAAAWCNLGIARAVHARYPEAEQALREALRLEPALVPALNQLAYVYAARYRDSRAPADRDTMLDLCAQSLSIMSQQDNIRSLRNAVLDVEREALDETATEDED